MSKRTYRCTVLLVMCAGLCLSDAARAGEEVWPMPEWPRAAPVRMGMEEARLRQARDYALRGGGSGCIIRRGRLVFQWGDQKRRYDLKSTTKSIGVTALGLALSDAKIKSLAEKARTYHPDLGGRPASNAETGWLDRITLFHLATQTAGFDKSGGYTALLFQPGTKWSYSDGGPNWLAECVTLVYKQDLHTLMFERVFTPLGIKPTDLTWRRNAYRSDTIGGVKRREFGSGVSANVNAMARIGYLYLREGRWRDRQIIPKEFVRMARTVPHAIEDLPVLRAKRYPNASAHYGLLWWNNADGTLRRVPTDAYWSWGLYDSLIVVIPSLDVVIARAGRSFRSGWSGGYDVLAPFLEPIVSSVRSESVNTKAPYPRSQVIAGLTWAPADTIVRRAKGSDNWPLTWADDDNLYTAYGDGDGFKSPKAPRLSLGLAKISGPPENFTGTNIRSSSAEQKGDGPSGKKASGMLMVDGVLYMWVRNAGNSQLAWSKDRGKAWRWADWKFTTSFGAPTFLNFGKNYAGARDEYVYVYSFDSETAYKPADRMVLARVPKDRIVDREAYEFFVRLNEDGSPAWTKDLAQRGAVFSHPGRCYRSGVSYNAPLKRYLWWQVIPGGDTRFKGGLGVYDAPEPWGPWTTVTFTERWDVGPGESGSLPTKWMSADGKTIHLVCSNTDHFTVRKATLTLTAAEK